RRDRGCCCRSCLGLPLLRPNRLPLSHPNNALTVLKRFLEAIADIDLQAKLVFARQILQNQQALPKNA
ncbi:MAG: hypothetical protein AAFW95_11370, partial [Cyanobacteria bacterium J06638_6]